MGSLASPFLESKDLVFACALPPSLDFARVDSVG
jgi:hypothetical protein